MSILIFLKKSHTPKPPVVCWPLRPKCIIVTQKAEMFSTVRTRSKECTPSIMENRRKCICMKEGAAAAARGKLPVLWFLWSPTDLARSTCADPQIPQQGDWCVPPHQNRSLFCMGLCARWKIGKPHRLLSPPTAMDAARIPMPWNLWSMFLVRQKGSLENFTLWFGQWAHFWDARGLLTDLFIITNRPSCWHCEMAITVRVIFWPTGYINRALLYGTCCLFL